MPASQWDESTVMTSLIVQLRPLGPDDIIGCRAMQSCASNDVIRSKRSELNNHCSYSHTSVPLASRHSALAAQQLMDMSGEDCQAHSCTAQHDELA